MHLLSVLLPLILLLSVPPDPASACEVDRTITVKLDEVVNQVIHTFSMATRSLISVVSFPHGFSYNKETGGVKVTDFLTGNQFVLSFTCTQSGTVHAFSLTVKRPQRPTTTVTPTTATTTTVTPTTATTTTVTPTTATTTTVTPTTATTTTVTPTTATTTGVKTTTTRTMTSTAPLSASTSSQPQKTSTSGPRSTTETQTSSARHTTTTAPTTSTISTTPSGQKDDTLVIAVGVAFSTLFVILLGIIIYCLRIKRKKQPTGWQSSGRPPADSHQHQKQDSALTNPSLVQDHSKESSHIETGPIKNEYNESEEEESVYDEPDTYTEIGLGSDQESVCTEDGQFDNKVYNTYDEPEFKQFSPDQNRNEEKSPAS